MIPTVQFDPSTLAIWTTTGLLEEPAARKAGAAMRAAVRGSNPAEVLADVAEDDPLRARLVWLASAVWHEKRHFFDTLLTNYGARRFRDLFMLAANFDPLLAHAADSGEPVWFPVEVYSDPVQRLVLGISEPPPNVLQIASKVRLMKGFMARLDEAEEAGDQTVHIGGEAQLEGLAQASQLNSVAYTFGVRDALSVTAEHVHRLPRSGPYRAIELLGQALGCQKDSGGGSVLVNLNLASAVFVASLCGRFFGVGGSPAADLVKPSERLGRILAELGPRPGRFEMSDEEAAEMVDKVARRIWGRTPFDEMAADIDRMGASVTVEAAPWLSEEGLYDAYQDFVGLRRRLLAAARDAGPASLLPRAFPLLWRDRLHPWHVLATPGGTGGEAEGRIVFGRRLKGASGLPVTVVWGRLHTHETPESDDVLAVQDDSAWLQMLERHGPRALLMLNGRRHRRMIPPEIERMVSETEGLGVEVRFHPRFGWPEARDAATCVAEAVALAEFSGRRTLVCDITGDELQPSEAAVLTAWEFRRSPLVETFRQEAGFLAEFKLATDWSDWVVRRDLVGGTELATSG